MSKFRIESYHKVKLNFYTYTGFEKKKNNLMTKNSTKYFSTNLTQFDYIHEIHFIQHEN